MKKTLRVVMNLEVSDLSPEERRGSAQDACDMEGNLPTLQDTLALDVARVLEAVGSEGLQDTFFEGTDLFVKFTAADIDSAEWVE